MSGNYQVSSFGLKKLARSLYHTSGLSKLRRTLRERSNNKEFEQYRAVDRFEADVEGVKIFFSSADSYSKHWFFPRYGGGKIHEEAVTLLLLETLRNSQCFVDVGTNLGWYTCLASRAMPAGSVYGFEMDELNFALLQKNIAINHSCNVDVYHAAVTDVPGHTSYMRISANPNPGLQLCAGVRVTASREIISVKAITLDKFFEDKEVGPDVVKIDVEGAEMKVLKGMEGIMKVKAPKLFVEIHPKKMTNFKYSVQDLVSFLIDTGYQVFEIEQMRAHGVARNLRKLSQESYLTLNTMLYCCR